MTTRREILQHSLPAALAVGAGIGAAVSSAAGIADKSAALIVAPDLSFLRDNAPVDVERARHFMAVAGLDALVVTQAPNVYYLSGHWPQLDRMRHDHTALAILPRDPARPVSVIMPVFLWYYTHSAEFGNRPYVMYTYSAPDPAAHAAADASEPIAIVQKPYRIMEPALLTEREKSRRAALQRVHYNGAEISYALAAALRDMGLSAANLGTDSEDVKVWVEQRGLAAHCRPAENLLRRVRMAKSPTELQVMRIAARNNVAAALEAAQQARQLGSKNALRQAFFAAASRHGNTGVFMVVDGASTDLIDAPIRDGDAFSIDCVSHCRHYHGDFSRTVFIGEPRPALKRITSAVAVAWQEIREQLRPGMLYAEIPRIGRESLKKQGVDVTISFTPHSVGLWHTDQPYASAREPAAIEPLRLEENMVLSVDCPLMDTAVGGTTHLEDLMWIRTGGAQCLHDRPPTVITV